MSIYNTIKIECDSKLPAYRATDTQTERPAEFWLFNNLKFGVVLFCNGELFSDFSNVSKLVLGVKECDNGGYPLESDTFEILKEVAAADIEKDLTEMQRANGSVHATFAIEAGDIAATMKAGMKWLVVQAVDSSGGALTFFGGNILCKNDASSGTASGATLTRFESYKTACENAKKDAENSAKDAKQYASDAESAKVQVAGSVTSASQYANYAGSYAESAKTYADNASKSATAAESSAKTATTQADLAATSAQTAQQAAAQATEISDPEGWRTNTRDLITDLAASKSNIGTFHFGTAGGALQTTGNPMYGVLDQSHCMTLELDEDFQFSTHSAMSLNFTGDNQYNSGYYGIGLMLGANGRFLLRAGNGSRGGGYFGNAPLLNNLFGGTDPNTIPAGKYAFCLCMHFDTTDPTASTAKIYVNGENKWDFTYPMTTDENSVSVPLQTSTIAWLENSKLGFFDTTNYHKTDSTNFGYGHFEGNASRFAVFNFDMSASDAPYTPGDYASGKRIPVALQSSTAEKRCIVASADYSFGGKVRDISGNENHLTVYGDVKGDKDEAVRQMYNAFSAAYTAENATS